MTTSKYNGWYRAITIIAITITAYFLSAVIHEGLGHGGACLLEGGRPIAISSNFFDCDNSAMSAWQTSVVVAGGGIANMIAAGILYLLLRKVKNTSAETKYFLWLLTTISLLQAGGYLLVSPFANFGDWKEFIQGLPHPIFWKSGLTLIGLGISYAGLRMGAKYLHPFISGKTTEERKRTADNLINLSYFSGGIVDVLAGLMYLKGGLGLIIISSIASSFGGTAWLLMIPWYATTRSSSAPTGDPMIFRGNIPWIVMGVIAMILFVFVFGPSIALS